MSPLKSIQLFWDFRGPDAQHTSKHFEQHLLQFLKTYADRKELNCVEIIQNQEFWYSCSLTIEEPQLSALKTTLKPHRGIYL
ncbi:MAG: hypothetical protein O3A09_03295 [Bacteroidetes bacterium]|nr:hypothetical protein [Bacteroidota bacterium]